MDQGTGWEPLTNAILARRLNLALGGPFVAPWDVPELDDTTIEVALSMNERLPGMQRGRAKVEALFAAFRAKHETYRKH